MILGSRGTGKEWRRLAAVSGMFGGDGMMPGP